MAYQTAATDDYGMRVSVGCYSIVHCWRKYIYIYIYMPVPVVARSKMWVCGRSPAEIVSSNPTGGIDVCLL